MSARPAFALLLMGALVASSCGDDGPAGVPPLGDRTIPGPPTTAGPPPAPPRLAAAEVTLTAVATAEEPVALAVRPGDPDDVIWVAEKAGAVTRAALEKGAVVDPDDQLDLSGRVSGDSEQGLLGLAFSPDGERLYLNLTDLDGNTVVVEYAMDGDRVDAGSERVVLTVDQPFSNHNGGHLAFGPDGFLYIGLGDGGSGGDPLGNGQDPSTLLGSMVRIDPAGEGDGDYTVPPDNPFVEGPGPAGARVEVWAYGLRNPWRYSFDSATGDLWIGDVGQDAVEEIDRLVSDAPAGANLGWAELEGTQALGGGSAPPGVIAPVLEYRHGGGVCAVTGGYVYRGTAIHHLEGAYVYGDQCVAEVRALKLGADEQVEDRGLGAAVPAETLVSFGQGGDGELYVVSLAGQISRLDPTP